MTTLRAPFPYFGGKSRAAHLIWARFGNPRHFIDPFFGSGAVLWLRPTPPQLETVNDLAALVANFWRAVTGDPEEVARWCDWPINEADLHSRHLWLVQQTEWRERMLTDPFFYDAQIAGWWAWGLSCWIGGGWCAGTSSWDGRPFADGAVAKPRKPALQGHAHKGVHRQIPDLGGKAVPGGRGVHRKRPALSPSGGRSGGGAGRGVHSKRPILTAHGGGAGIHAKRPHLSNNVGGKGVHRQRPGPENNGGRTGVHQRDLEGLVAWFEQLQARLRRVRVCCGDWTRVVTPAVLAAGGERSITAVLLDPPYADTERAAGIYTEDSTGVAAATRQWAIANGDNPRLRIALCGYEGEHEMPSDWEVVSWRAGGGYGSQDGPDANRHRERIWFSRHCLRQPSLFDEGLYDPCGRESGSEGAGRGEGG